ncbi:MULTISPECIES: M56 family metallopeptidase [unclassified Dyella]|uniref:M56 family metallopeptidase n=1 Tax=unclassified Dyella TaxID=2634549 RepID=UPI000C841EFE|nr:MULTISPECIES: M56 family metallopeptidase [unclassified Dyella]MDR3444799.1 M56 family metallopeptidase [Dyella sp.]PMQ06136.1 Regulatory protein BlaR1 [Dyella sp. AD56]
MNSLELVSRAWLLLLSLSMALLAVAALRPVCRRWLGAESAFQLWLLPPLAVLASQLPHAVGAVSRPLPPLVLTVTTAAGAMGTTPLHDENLHWQDLALALWLLGVAVNLTAAIVSQWRYQRLLGAGTSMDGGDRRWAVLRADRDDIGPALVGAWRPRIVVPADFDRRYSPEERALILAHEEAHAGRHDGFWSLCARLLFVVCWCHPAVWWAYRAFRLDQELACDAAVMKRHRGQRHLYAQTMLKTQSAAFPLPVGCPWLSRHPITERIAMLKLSPPGKTGRIVGGVAMLALGVAITGALYAATDTKDASNGNHRLKIELGINGEPAKLHADMCLKPGQHYDAVQTGIDPLPAWQVRLSVVPGPENQLEVQTQISGGSLDKPVQPGIRMLPGQTGGIQVGQKIMGKDGNELDRTLKMDLTPSNGC